MAILTDGFPTFVNLRTRMLTAQPGFAGVMYKEKSVTPPGLDSNGKNDITSMRNTSLRTAVPKQLVTMTEFKMTVFYDSRIYAPIDVTQPSGVGLFWQMLRTNCMCFAYFPDGSCLAFWGWLDKLVPQDIKEGEAPTAEANVQCGNCAFIDGQQIGASPKLAMKIFAAGGPLIGGRTGAGPGNPVGIVNADFNVLVNPVLAEILPNWYTPAEVTQNKNQIPGPLDP